MHTRKKRSRKNLKVKSLPDIVYGIPSEPLQIGNITDILRIRRVYVRGLEIEMSILDLQRRNLEIHHIDRKDGYFEIEIPEKNRIEYERLISEIADSKKQIASAHQNINCVNEEIRYRNCQRPTG